MTRYEAEPSAPEGLLCVANFPSNTGYAWDFIEGIYAAISYPLTSCGIRTWVAYPEIESPPKTLLGSPAVPVELPVGLRRPAMLIRLIRFIRTRRIRVLYLSDRPAWHPAFVLLRLAGVRWIVTHDHTSGERTVPQGTRGLIKRATRAFRPAMADRVLAVSEFVARRKREVDLIPPDRVVKIWNFLHPDAGPAGSPSDFRMAFDVPASRPVVLSIGRATPEKGIQILLEAFDVLWQSWRLEAGPRPVLVYMGSGPYFDELSRIASNLRCSPDVRMPGYVPEASRWLGSATVCVVPSLWEEAFGLAALEPMGRGRAVVASAVGGIPEIVLHNETGLLVPPGEPTALAEAIKTILVDQTLRERLESAAAIRARERFGPERALDAIKAQLLAGGVGHAQAPRPGASPGPEER